MAEQRVVVWVDRGALDMETRIGREIEIRTQPEADTAIRHLVDADYRVVLVGADPSFVVEDVTTYAGVELAPALPDDASGWLVTSDEVRCGAVRRHRGLRTILVGPTIPDRGLAQRVSDHEARDLVDAALIILAADAMPDVAIIDPAPAVPVPADPALPVGG